MGVKLGDRELEHFDRYLALLKKWSRKISLTSVKDERDMVIKLILDSLLIYKNIRDSWFVMDIGSGQGCPGIPLKVAHPSIRLLMLESRGKKVNFLKTVIRELGLKDCQAIQQRAEDPLYRDALRGRLDAVVARAVADTARMVSIAMPYVKPAGSLILMKGSRAKEELDLAKPIMEKTRVRLESSRELSIPGTDWTRNVVTIKWA